MQPLSLPIKNAKINLKTLTAGARRGHMFDFVWILIANSKPCQGTHLYQARVQSKPSSFILKDFSHRDKQRCRMQMTPDT